MAEAGPAPGRRLEGRHVLITGAASGIGRATAELFAAHGARLALVDRDGDGVKVVADALGVAAFTLDLADLPAVEPMVERAAQAIGGLDGVVNCAALATPKSIAESDLALLTAFSAVNLVAPMLICRGAVAHMRKAGRGTVVNIASGQGLLPNAPNNTAYAATKGGLISFSKSLAAELATENIRVNAIAPGVVQTGMTRFLLDDYQNPNDAPFVQQYAMKRVAQPIELANAILFLTGDESSYVTGSALAVDGGRCFH